MQDHLKVKQSDQIVARIDGLQQEVKQLNVELEKLSAEALKQEADNYFNDVQSAGDLTFVGLAVKDQSADAMRSLGDMWRDKAVSNVLVLASDNGDAATLMVFSDDDAIASGVKAGDLIKPLAKLVGGGGGGRPNMAQAGGKNAAGIPEVMDAIAGEIESLVK